MSAGNLKLEEGPKEVLGKTLEVRKHMKDVDRLKRLFFGHFLHRHR